jgi:pSer/pThr/pTyr-binding forkhead associated (FHA) protein
LRKRADVDTAFVDRISVGRARNKDIVLRHGSISKFHGWFQVDEANTVYFADAGSKNGTRVDGTLVAPRAPMELRAGSRITLGRIELSYCPTELLWRSLRGL